MTTKPSCFGRTLGKFSSIEVLNTVFFVAYRVTEGQLKSEDWQARQGTSCTCLTGVIADFKVWRLEVHLGKFCFQVLKALGYSVFCRLVTEGLKEDWQPVKVADMFEGVIGDFKAAISNLGEIVRGRDGGPSAC